MNLEEFIGTLDPQNPQFDELSFYIRFLDRDAAMVLQRKGSNLVEVIADLIAQGRFPIVDKRLRMVFGLAKSQHMILREKLFLYHNPTLRDSSITPTVASDSYIIDGCGYFISSVQTNTIVVGQIYRQDRFDKDLFLLYRLDDLSSIRGFLV